MLHILPDKLFDWIREITGKVIFSFIHRIELILKNKHMKKLSRILMIVVFATINYQSYGQVFSIRAGANTANCAIDNHIHNLATGTILGLNFGGTTEFMVSDKYSIETGLIINYKGINEHVLGGIDTATRLVYLDIPINVKYKFELGENKLYLTAGPYIGYGIAGLYTYKINGERNGDKVEWSNGSTSNDFKRLDYGINLGAEYEFGVWGIGLQYGHGLANILSSENE